MQRNSITGSECRRRGRDLSQTAEILFFKDAVKDSLCIVQVIDRTRNVFGKRCVCCDAKEGPAVTDACTARFSPDDFDLRVGRMLHPFYHHHINISHQPKQFVYFRLTSYTEK